MISSLRVVSPVITIIVVSLANAFAADNATDFLKPLGSAQQNFIKKCTSECGTRKSPKALGRCVESRLKKGLSVNKTCRKAFEDYRRSFSDNDFDETG